ncbi:thymidine phosphorylase [Anabrus simplex]|uniref:thymidine phosphorylase n=1 Tax=Anabrus simplex TaxID=316456 RepID=UPI0035A36905
MSTTFTVPNIIAKKRDGESLTKEEIDWFIEQVINGKAQDCQIGAMLMAIYLQNMTEEETVNFTKSMVQSGDVLKWDSSWTMVDKHSTGGVGDKVSLPLAPALAALGFKVPMISGRGLEITGGTLDKLESIPGYNVSCTQEQMRSALTNAGCFIAGATGKLAPADKELYKRRDVTATVNSNPLVVGSILSKKAAEGSQYLVMDIKVGAAAFYKTVKDARELAQELIKVSAGLGLKTRAALTSMDTPIGWGVGNSLEVAESVMCLRGQGRPDLVELVATTGGLILEMNNKVKNLEEGIEAVKMVLNNGKALEHFHKMLLSQGVKAADAEELCNGDMWKVLPSVPKNQVTVMQTAAKGIITHIDALKVGTACWAMGAGRSHADQPIDYRVGVVLLKFVGDSVAKDEPWIEVHHATPQLQEDIRNLIKDSITIATDAGDLPDSRIIEIL